MFYIVEEETKLNHLTNLAKHSAFVEVITTNSQMHSSFTDVVAVYIRPEVGSCGYIIPVDHDEGINVTKDRIYTLLNSITTLYTLDKKSLLYHFNIQGAIDVSLLYSMTKYERLEVSSDNPTVNWYNNKYKDFKDVNKLVPLSKIYENSEKTYKSVEKHLGIDIPEGFEFYNTTATNVFFLLEHPGLGIHYQPFIDTFTPKSPMNNIKDGVTYTSYNLYNSTSRPTNAFNSVNYAAIPKSEEHRKCFHPQNDLFVEFDFDGYHLRLLCEQIGYPLTDESAHKQLAKHYFGTEDISEEQYLEAKQINFQAIYGKIPEEHRDLKIFKGIQEYIDNMWSLFKQNGVVFNPISGKPFTSNLKEMHPAKLMNYMMQSLETARNILILKDILRYLKDKRTKAVLYTYDAILFDFDKEEGKEVLEGIKDILEQGGKYPVKFKYSKDLVL